MSGSAGAGRDAGLEYARVIAIVNLPHCQSTSPDPFDSSERRWEHSPMPPAKMATCWTCSTGSSTPNVKPFASLSRKRPPSLAISHATPRPVVEPDCTVRELNCYPLNVAAGARKRWERTLSASPPARAAPPTRSPCRTTSEPPLPTISWPRPSIAAPQLPQYNGQYVMSEGIGT